MNDVCQYIAKQLLAYQEKQDDAPASALMHFSAALLAARLQRVPSAAELFAALEDDTFLGT